MPRNCPHHSLEISTTADINVVKSPPWEPGLDMISLFQLFKEGAAYLLKLAAHSICHPYLVVSPLTLTHSTAKIQALRLLLCMELNLSICLPRPSLLKFSLPAYCCTPGIWGISPTLCALQWSHNCNCDGFLVPAHCFPCSMHLYKATQDRSPAWLSEEKWRASHIIPFLRQLLANPTSVWFLLPSLKTPLQSSPLQGYRQSHCEAVFRSSQIPSKKRLFLAQIHSVVWFTLCICKQPL